MLKLNAIMIGTMQEKPMVAFYQGVLGKPPEMEDEKEGFHGWQVGDTYFSILRHSEMKGKSKEGGRVMLNFETTQVKEEFQRVKGLGASVIAEPYEMGGGWIATLADPDGNYFQLVTPM